MDRYRVGKVLGEGTFGIVSLAVEISSGKSYAIKHFKAGKFKDGVNFTALREMKLQRELAHPNIVALHDVFLSSTGTLSLVFEFLPSNLEDLIKSKTIVLTPGDIKTYMHMILSGTAYCHHHWLLHR